MNANPCGPGNQGKRPGSATDPMDLANPVISNPVSLSDEEIVFLFRFCDGQGVHYYDVQSELVDHLAGAIEQQMGAHPEWDFEKALDAVYQGFGKEGFAPLLAEKHRAVKRQTWNWVLNQFRASFRWPKIVMTLALGIFFYISYQLPGKEFVFPAMIAPFVLLYGFILWEAFRVKRLQYSTGRKFMLTKYIGAGEVYFLVFYFSVIRSFVNEYPYPHVNHPERMPYSHGVLFALWMIIGIAYYQVLIQIRRKLEREYVKPMALTLS